MNKYKYKYSKIQNNIRFPLLLLTVAYPILCTFIFGILSKTYKSCLSKRSEYFLKFYRNNMSCQLHFTFLNSVQIIPLAYK